MFDPKIIFQRSHAGRNEIYEKKCGLTQSERLVLIMIDGSTAYSGVRGKLPSLTDVRFDRALVTLQKKELITEVFLPVAGQAGEEMDKSVVDRFLQQDPTDPLTIISFDPEDEFDMMDFGTGPSPASSPTAQPATKAPVTHPSSHEPPVVSEISNAEPAMNDALIQQADQLTEEVRAARRAAVRNERPSEPEPQVNEMPSPPEMSTRTADPLHWGYWMIALGVAFIAGYLLARLHS